MRLRISDFGFRIAVAVIAPALLATTAPAQPAPSGTQPVTATRPDATAVPVTFARSGKTVTAQLSFVGRMMGGLQLEDGREVDRLVVVERVVLRAFGRDWTDNIPVKFVPLAGNERNLVLAAEIPVPIVRVPTVFFIVPSEPHGAQGARVGPVGPDDEIGQLVAYPDQDVAWDEKIVLYSCGAPEWFDQWATATGLPLKTITPAGLPTAELGQVGEDTKTLLILSPNATGRRDPAHVVKLANEKAVNILVLDADWLGDAAGPVEFGGGQMRGDLLAVTGKQSWRGPLQFRFCRRPCGAVMNRWAWILGEDGLPLVESVADGTAPPEAARSVVLSYLSWEDQLGRREEADATLLAILSAAAKAAPPKIAGHPVEFIYPKKTELNAKDRPVLSAVRSVEPVPREDRKPDYNPPIYSFLDLRGKEEIRYSDGDLSEICRNSISNGRQPVCELIILGDDKMLDEWEWLRLDRAKKLIGAAGVQWLPDDELPPSKENQIRLMLKLTELGVPLAPPEQEEEKK